MIPSIVGMGISGVICEPAIYFAVAFLRPDGQANENTSLEIILQHLDHLIEHLGEDGVAFGSDFDGTTVPKDIKDASGLTKLRQAMSEHGYKQNLQENQTHLLWDSPNWGLLHRHVKMVRHSANHGKEVALLCVLRFVL